MSSPINWLRTLNSAGIEYIERGSNVAKGHVNIHCPWCGAADPSHHLGIQLSTGYWGCWRNSQHRGKSPLRLLVRLLGISYHRAREMAGLDADYADPEGFDAVAARVLQRSVVETAQLFKKQELAIPEGNRPIKNSGATRRHWEYLVEQRGFLPQDIDLLMQWYLVVASVSGTYHDRILLPYVVDWEIVSWTARAISDARIRYLDLSKDESLVEPKQTLYNHDAAFDGGQVLLVVEGPFDALKLDLYGRDWGVRAVALSTNSISDQQIYLLEEASINFDRVLVMMDNAGQLGVVDSMRMKERLSQIHNLGFTPVPYGRKDGGDLLPAEVINYSRGITTCQSIRSEISRGGHSWPRCKTRTETAQCGPIT